jgi:hypothetical protein
MNKYEEKYREWRKIAIQELVMKFVTAFNLRTLQDIKLLDEYGLLPVLTAICYSLTAEKVKKGSEIDDLLNKLAEVSDEAERVLNDLKVDYMNNSTTNTDSISDKELNNLINQMFKGDITVNDILSDTKSETETNIESFDMNELWESLSEDERKEENNEEEENNQEEDS